jgi:3',5'-cyclic AMP phosphodiesterase CpdA
LPIVLAAINSISIIPGGNDPVINAVGDIAACDARYTQRDGFYQTAALLQQLDGTILGLGDYVYFAGIPSLYTNCFDPVWGQLKARIHPAVGNHEYDYPNASGYFQYFGTAAGDPTLGYYSYDLGAWHVVVLNTNCSNAGALNGCMAGSPQEQWLRADLAAHPNFCTLAYYHHPFYSSGKEGSFWRGRDLYQALVDYHVDVIVTGHDHSYERFAPQDANGNFDPILGIPEFVAGTGGKDHSPLIKRLPNSLVFDNTTFGVLRMVLHANGYDFQFIPVAGSVFTDSGSGTCH